MRWGEIEREKLRERESFKGDGEIEIDRLIGRERECNGREIMLD